jgi:hypothetical protein
MRFDAGHHYDDPAVFYDSPEEPETPPNPQPLGTMIRLTRFLTNPFRDPAISLAEEMAFGTDHLERMVANNPGGALDARIAATSTALDVLSTCAGNDLIKLGVRRARKSAKDAFRASLPEHTRRIQGVLEGIFGIESAQVKQAFPEGRNALTQCTDDLLLSKLQSVSTVVAANAAELPPAIVTLAAGLVPNWTALHAESETATGDKTATEDEKRAARTALQDQFFLTLAKLMELFPNQPDQLLLYMQQHLLEDHPAEEEEEPEPEPEPEG